MTTDRFTLCDRCGERLGVYEPLVLEFSDGTVLHGGLLALRDRAGGDARLRHARCHEDGASPGNEAPSS